MQEASQSLTQQNPLTQQNRWGPYCTLLAGILLTTASIAGLCGNLGGLFFFLWSLHLIALLAAVGFECITLFKTARDGSSLGWACLSLTFLGWIVSISLGLLPITARDALIHHLVVPKWWLAEGRIFSVPWHDWSYYPMLLQTGFTGLMSANLIALTPLYHFFYGVLLACAAGQLVRQQTGSARYQMVTVCTVALLPAVLKLGSVPLVDLGLALFCTLTILFLNTWLAERRLLLLVGAGISLGCALSTKYNGLLFTACLLPFALLAAHQAKAPLRALLQAILVIGTCAALINSPWLLRNYQVTGNPVFPLYQGIFGPPSTKPVDAKAARGLTPLQTRLMLHGESPLELALLPVRVFVSGEDENPRLFDGRLSPFFLLAVLPAFWVRRNASSVLLLGSSFLYFFLSLLMADARVRYLAPIYGSLAVLSSVGLFELEKRIKRPHLGSVPALALVLQGFWSLFYTQGLLAKTRAEEYFTGKLSREAYLEQTVPEYSVAQFMNANLPKDSRTYMVLTGNRFFYFNTPVISSGHASAGELLRWIRSAKSPEDIYSELAERQFTHLLLHAPRTSKLFETSLSPDELSRWNSFRERHLSLVTSDRGAMLFAVRE